MDKNMINIDDLFKQRLSGGEKDERPGAWLQMREMLDQKMPVTPQPTGSTFNWRRMLGVLAGVATLSAVSVGGYELATSFRQGGDAAGNGPVMASNTKTGVAHTARIAANSQQQFSGHSANAGTTNAEPVTVNTSANTGNSQSINRGTTVNTNITGTANNTEHNTSNTNGSVTTNASNMSVATNSGTTSGNSTVAGNNGNTASGNTINTAASNTVSGSDRTNANSKTNSSNTFQANTVVSSGNSNIGGSNQSGFSNSLDNNDLGSATGMVASNNPSASANLNDASATNNTDNNSSSATRNRGTLNRRNTSQKRNVFSSAAKLGNTSLSKTGTGSVNANGNGGQSSTGGIVNNKANNNTGGNIAKNNTTPKPGNNTGRIRSNNNIKPAIDQSVADNTAPKYTLVKEPIKKIEILERYGKGGQLKVDTIFIGTIEMDKYVLASSDKPSGDEQVLQASSSKEAIAANKGNVKEELVPLQRYRTSHNKQPLWEPRRFEEMVQNAKLNMSQVRFYPGLIIGANTLLSGKNSMSGFQLGLSGTLSLNDHWGLFTELKYIHRFNNSTLDSKSEKITSSIINGTTTYTVTPKTSQFSFPSISSMELPIAVRYTLNRINIFMGVNYAYYFATNPSLIEVNEAPVTTTTEPAVDPNAVDLAATDFSSRYGVGYMLGMGYHVTPAVHLDFRLAHSVWDNANTSGTRYVSQNLFRVPTLQLNFNYRFSSKRSMR